MEAKGAGGVGMRKLGRTMQFLGLMVLPFGMILELTHAAGPDFGTRQLLVMMLFGVAVFYIGRIVEGYAQS